MPRGWSGRHLSRSTMPSQRSRRQSRPFWMRSSAASRRKRPGDPNSPLQNLCGLKTRSRQVPNSSTRNEIRRRVSPHGRALAEKSMSSSNPTFSDMQHAVRDTVRLHWRLFLTQGVIMVILGLLAVIWPGISTIAVDVYVGWLFLLSGSVMAATSI